MLRKTALAQPSFDAVVKMNHDNKYSIAPPLENDIYAEFYHLRKNASTITASTIEWFRNHLKNLLDEMRYQTILYGV